MSIRTLESSPSRRILGIATGGLLAGTGDLLFAFVFYGLLGVTPMQILFSIASGWLGRGAYGRGAAPAVLGLVSHYGIACGASAVYSAASQAAGVLVRRPVPCGIAYGVMVYAVMNFVIVPLSAFPFDRSFPPSIVIPGLAAHMVLVGLPIALAVSRFTRAS